MLTSPITQHEITSPPSAPLSDLQGERWQNAAHCIRLARLRRIGLHGDIASLVALLAYGEVQP